MTEKILEEFTMTQEAFADKPIQVDEILEVMLKECNKGKKHTVIAVEKIEVRTIKYKIKVEVTDNDESDNRS